MQTWKRLKEVEDRITLLELRLDTLLSALKLSINFSQAIDNQLKNKNDRYQK